MMCMYNDSRCSIEFISWLFYFLSLLSYWLVSISYSHIELLLFGSLIERISFKFLAIIILNLFFSIDHWIGVSILIIKELKHTIQRFHNIDIMDMKRHIDENWHLPSPHNITHDFKIANIHNQTQPNPRRITM